METNWYMYDRADEGKVHGNRREDGRGRPGGSGVKRVTAGQMREGGEV